MNQIGANVRSVRVSARVFRKRLGKDILRKLHLLEDHIKRLLSKAIEKVGYNNIVIITNAQKGWVELSAERYVPGVLPYLNRLKVVSARTSYEQVCQRPSSWKMHAFYDELQKSFGCSFPPPTGISAEVSRQIDETQQRQHTEQHNTHRSPTFRKRSKEAVYAFADGGGSTAATSVDGDSRDVSTAKQVISLGDSQAERMACTLVVNNMSNTLLKVIKFVERPTIEQVIKQLKIMNSQFDSIVDVDHALDLKMQTQLSKDGSSLPRGAR